MMYGNQSDSCYGLQVQVNGNLIATGFGQQEQQQMMASFNKSWAQQTEESYQLQLALALRVSSQAASAADSYFLDFNSDANKNNRNGSFPLTSQDVSHRFWVNGSLSYFDRILDGFYLIHGMDPYAWTISADQGEIGQMPSFDSLKAIDPHDDLSIKVVLIDKLRDPRLRELQNCVLKISSSWVSTKDVIDQLARLVCNQMGDAASSEEGVYRQWKECTKVLKDCLGSIVFPIGSLSFGLCVHRALLFKVLADLVNLPCRITKGCKYCQREDASSCLVQLGVDREYLVDMFAEPGALSRPDSSLNGTSSILVSSPLCHPRFKLVETATSIRKLSKLYFVDDQSCKHTFDDASSDNASNQDEQTGPQLSKAFDMNYFNKNKLVSTLINNNGSTLSPLHQRTAWNIYCDKDLQMQNSSNLIPKAIASSHLVRSPLLPSSVPSGMQNDACQALAFSDPRQCTANSVLFKQSDQPVMSIDHGDLDIPWSELVLKEKIGAAGSFGTVHRAELRGCEVAVKILLEQGFHAERFREFLREVAIMKRLRHPNIVLFMGAVTQPPKLSIVTEYLSRGSLFRLLQMPDAALVLDERCRLNMALDVARGMNYLHQLKPPIVHRDLKSPNLLVDSTYTVKVCDFGLSCSKANTFLSSKTAVGTPEWMAPEVLCDEPSNEKSDVYSFGVVLWELVTLQQPWKNLNPPQVVAAVGFKGKRLEIPSNVNPVVASLIELCWANDTSKRPSFSYVMECLYQVITNTASQKFHRQIS
ncbi:Map3k delta-1 protein kinase, putative isoform 3 [Theobroma cacao]|uniref:non-specific serine/threonine protein kinase n=1 Tax=Theobroma cacao TaxID=3641 RepID=A0A061FWC0_THECC|nr:Map3k delta-1 protein kinase, putative isoform 3 [Theobroma cacao]